MADTHDFTVTSEKSTPRSTAYRNDPFTIHNGHYIGHDGFVVPTDFTEFYRRFPAYVPNWVRRRTRGCSLEKDADDWTQELLLFLATLPEDSIHRRNGKLDVIQTFAPERMHGANEARFRSFINRCLSNKFNALYRKWRLKPLSNASSMSFDVDTDGGAADEFCHINSAFLRTWELRNRERDEQRLRLREFVGLTEPSIPGLPRFVEVFRTTGSWEETATLLGRERCECIRRSLRQLAMRMG